MLKSSLTLISISQSFLEKKEKLTKVDPIVPETFDKDWIKGFWNGQGYGCGSSNDIEEDINVEYVNGEFVATKESGDDCVPSGKVTFRGKIPENFVVGQKYPCTITLGNPLRPASVTSDNCNIVPKEKDSFVVKDWDLTFTR